MKNKLYYYILKVEIENSKEAYVFSSIPLSVEKIDILYRFACFIENFDNQDNMDNKVFEENEIQYYALEDKDLFSILLIKYNIY